MDWEVENIPTILNVWFGGSEAADAICDVVFGDVAPSGKLTVTMPRNVGQIPIYYNHLNTGRPNPKWFTKFTSNYLDVPNDPLFPFGYGLSYTTFQYSPMTLSSNSMTQSGTIQASVTVTNTGAVEGSEVVQLYIRDIVGSIAKGKVANFFITEPIPSIDFIPYSYTTPIIARTFLMGQEMK